MLCCWEGERGTPKKRAMLFMFDFWPPRLIFQHELNHVDSSSGLNRFQFVVNGTEKLLSVPHPLRYSQYSSTVRQFVTIIL